MLTSYAGHEGVPRSSHNKGSQFSTFWIWVSQ